MIPSPGVLADIQPTSTCLAYFHCTAFPEPFVNHLWKREGIKSIAKSPRLVACYAGLGGVKPKLTEIGEKRVSG